MYIKTVKFGGSSLADAAQFKKVAQIIRSDDTRRYVVASAPGKRNSGDTKVTDMLYKCYAEAAEGADFSATFSAIKARFNDIIVGLGMDLSLEDEFDVIETTLRESPNSDYAASRGEFLNSKIMAAYLGVPFVDAASCIFFSENGTLDAERTNAAVSEKLSGLTRAVIPGFYGCAADGTIKTFSRGGSDITGSIVARAVGADVYENWTDVSGVMIADPRIVKNAKAIDTITYTELRELSYMGASVLHEDAIFPVKAAGIPINIRNTNDPDAPGTMIVREARISRAGEITGIAGRAGFSTLRIEKDQMNSVVGFVAEILTILANYGIIIEHIPTGIDTMSVIISSSALEGKRDALLAELHDNVHPDYMAIEDDVALIAIVGRGMVRHKGTAAKIFTACAQAGVNILMIDQGSSEINIILGVDSQDCEKSISAIYNAFCG